MTAQPETPKLCPECGRAFERPQALGAHRRQAHGVAGSSPRTHARRRAGGAIDRNALLRVLFPTGVPAREDVIRSLATWLDEAERLAALRR